MRSKKHSNILRLVTNRNVNTAQDLLPQLIKDYCSLVELGSKIGLKVYFLEKSKGVDLDL